jgi:hypothetical protein
LCKIASLTGRGLRKDFIDQLAALGGSPAADWITPRYKARVLRAAGKQALRSIGRLAPESRKLSGAISREEAAVRDCIRREAAVVAKSTGARAAGSGKGRMKLMRELDSIVVKRLVPGPVDPRGLMRQLTPARRARFLKRVTDQSGALMIGTMGLYWANGRRSIAEITRLVAAELGYTDPRFLKFYFGLLKGAGLVEYKSR